MRTRGTLLRGSKRAPSRVRRAGSTVSPGLGASLGFAVLLGLAASLGLAGCGGDTDRAPAASAPEPSRGAPPALAARAGEREAEDLVEAARERGLDHVNRSGGAEKRTILEANGAGVALLDLESDGDLDVVFAQGLASLGALRTGPGADLEVHRNDGRGRFSRAAGPGLSGWWTGLATGDLDGDGDQDLVAAGFGDLVVCLQDAKGALLPVEDAGTMPAEGLARWIVGASEAERGRGAPWWPTSIALFDADRDGALDLYVCQYLDFDPEAPPMHALGEGALAVPCRWKGVEVFCGPAGLTPQRDRLLLGRGDGTFRDASERLVDARPGYALAVLPFDADGDGDEDVFVANDSAPNVLWINDGRGTFRDHAFEAGVSHSADGRAQAGMGAAAGDVDRDGLFDFAITNFSDEPTELHLGSRTGFARATHRYGLQRETRRLLSWSVHIVDLDGDGWLELLQTNGHVYPQADGPRTGTSYGQPITAWRLGPEPVAKPIAGVTASSLLAPALGSRGAAIGDVDGDGDPDVVASRIDGPAALGINALGRDNARVLVRCLGPSERAKEAPRTPTDGMGTRVVLVCGSGASEHALLGEVATAQGYQSASSPWLHFGLGKERGYAAMKVLWPSGRVDVLPGGPANRRIVVREGEGVVSSEEIAR